MSERVLNESKWTWRNGPVRADVTDRDNKSPTLRDINIRADRAVSVSWSLNEMKAVRDLLADIIDHYTPNGNAK